MDGYADFFPQVLVVALLLMAALAAAPLARRVGLPAPAAFLGVGIVAGLLELGPVTTIGELPLEEIGAIALYGILFQGGIATGFGAWRRWARPILLLGLPGTAATAAGIALLARLLLGVDWSLAILIGVALSPTDPAAVYATLRGSGTSEGVRTILEGESGFNDPVGISFMVVAVGLMGDSGGGAAHGLARLGMELGIGVAGGVAGFGLLLLLLRATPRLDQSLQAGAMLAGAVVIGAGTASLHGSGFLAVYLCGLLLSDAWASQDGPTHAVPEAVAAIAEPILFGLLGAAFAPVLTGGDVWRGILVTLLTMLVVRPLVVVPCLIGTGLGRGETALVVFGGLKGAVPLLLAAFPALESLSEAARTEGIVLVATAASLVLQGASLKALSGSVARRPGRPAAISDPGSP